MRWTRLSFAYLIGYLAFGGMGLLAAPALAIGLLGSNATYPAALLRLLGGFMIALAVIVLQIARTRTERLYPTTLLVRVVLLSTVVAGYFESRDPMFLVLSAIVGLGMMLTAAGYVADRKARSE